MTERAHETPNWTDEDREKKRVYKVYVGKRLRLTMLCDLRTAQEAWSGIADRVNTGSVSLYHDRRSGDNLCCIQTVTP